VVAIEKLPKSNVASAPFVEQISTPKHLPERRGRGQPALADRRGQSFLAVIGVPRVVVHY
jgi:hypothetical protein